MENLASKSESSSTVNYYENLLRKIGDLEAVNARAIADQAALIESHGGSIKVLNRGGLHGTPVPSGPSTLAPV